MNRNKFLGALAVVVAAACFTLASCYNNKTDITSLPTVSFVNEVAPILTSGACGCHNGGTATAKQFSKPSVDSIYYDAIYGEGQTMLKWANGEIDHPGYGGVELTSSQITIIQNWAAEGYPDDQPVAGAANVTYAGTIAGAISSACGGGTCHGTNGGGAAGPALNQSSLSTTYLSTLTDYVNNNWSGHAGGAQSPAVTAEFKAWIANGLK